MGVRVLHLTLALVWLGCATAAAEPTIRVGSLRYGTLSWQLDVIANHGLDQKHGIRIDALELAGTPAAQLALQAGSVELIVSDWLWVSRQRAEGGDLTFIPFSSAIGSLIVPGASPIRDIAGLAGQRLGIAGSAIDKSWLVLRLYARAKFGLDLDGQVEKSFGAPPLLSEELAAGRLDAVLTFWPFAAKLEAHGMRPLLSIGDALAALGIPAHLPLTGYVVSTHWARENQAALDGFIAAARAANAILAASDAEWERILPLTGAADSAELIKLRDAYRDGIPRGWDEAERAAAARLYRLLADIGGSALVGPSPDLTPGTFLDGVRY
ncbi:MAG TPA: ABC transporter substrate-binding protein [Stellaceae bacterium]|nr:ABC transporter substrate-binding protein [Stellaceae bacterium]